MSGMWLVSYIAIWLVVILGTLLLLGIAREVGVIHVRLGSPGALTSDQGIDIGSDAPDFHAIEMPSGAEISVHAAGEIDTLLIFISPHCQPCRRLLPVLSTAWGEWQRRVQGHVICQGSEAEVRTLILQANVRIPLLADPLSRIGEAFGNPPTPYAFLIGADGTIKLKGVVNYREDIERLIDGQARVFGGQEIVVDDRRSRGLAHQEAAVTKEV